MSRAERIEAIKKEKEAKDKAAKNKARSQIVLEVKPADSDVGEWMCVCVEGVGVEGYGGLRMVSCCKQDGVRGLVCWPVACAQIITPSFK